MTLGAQQSSTRLPAPGLDPSGLGGGSGWRQTVHPWEGSGREEGPCRVSRSPNAARQLVHCTINWRKVAAAPLPPAYIGAFAAELGMEHSHSTHRCEGWGQRAELKLLTETRRRNQIESNLSLPPVGYLLHLLALHRGKHAGACSIARDPPSAGLFSKGPLVTELRVRGRCRHVRRRLRLSSEEKSKMQRHPACDGC